MLYDILIIKVEPPIVVKGRVFPIKIVPKIIEVYSLGSRLCAHRVLDWRALGSYFPRSFPGRLIIQASMANVDQDFVEYIVKAIVGRPEDVRVERKVDEMGVLLTVNVNPEDIGYVVGRQGQTIRAVRTLAKIVGAKNNARVNIKLNEPEGSRRSRNMGASASSTSASDFSTDDVDNLKI